MIIQTTNFKDIAIIHDVMIQAFSEYKNEVSPSSALQETHQMITDSFKSGEQALIAYENNQPIGMVRFKLNKSILYFYRLSVIPQKQGKGVAKNMLEYLETYGKKQGANEIQCKVRATVSKNISLYESMGYEVFSKTTIDKPNNQKLKIVSMKKHI
ncbi:MULTISPECIES: GNAT family N-acetyltransferase [Staphylococcus]|uniref:GNAT family N-acetyltransferase n=1 Tax=Staphylococcus xylosus TaxID=1288 RepID=A0A418IMY4_STAXY|nr:MULTISPECIES: GNAT family N-acetyltransferase [Staphylococcus]MDW8544531.1 GNAT family N-acetyltransferase [Staphylococcus sp. KG4-1]MDW8544634.1 GNAT family N-acetyltransferase [Staphylococcus pseudoxylosus]MDW8563201.1 GNAT family N-acetyltransferase [Staphylococcus sp. KG4-3]MDW8571588.1 GNAT family N-acetyltransferase [Staphylococcus shinii]MDW8574370.1 GNAT family N-acetyltransferase [Staphylococcus shinii]